MNPEHPSLEDYERCGTTADHIYFGNIKTFYALQDLGFPLSAEKIATFIKTHSIQNIPLFLNELFCRIAAIVSSSENDEALDICSPLWFRNKQSRVKHPRYNTALRMIKAFSRASSSNIFQKEIHQFLNSL